MINETELIETMARYILAYDMKMKLIPAIIEAAKMLNDTRKDNDEPDIKAIKEELESKYKWEFKFQEGE